MTNHFSTPFIIDTFCFYPFRHTSDHNPPPSLKGFRQKPQSGLGPATDAVLLPIHHTLIHYLFHVIDD